MTLRHFWFSQSTPAIDKIINMKNARAWVSMVSDLKKYTKIVI